MDHPEGSTDATGAPLWEREVADEPSLVRPYTLTAGRTEPRVHLPLEAPIGDYRRPSRPGGPETMCGVRFSQ